MNRRTLLASAMTGLVAMGAATASTQALAGPKMEKCYGVAKAGKNDCATKVNSCAGTNKVNGNPNAFVVVPEGVCQKLVHGSLTPAYAKKGDGSDNS